MKTISFLGLAVLLLLSAAGMIFAQTVDDDAEDDDVLDDDNDDDTLDDDTLDDDSEDDDDDDDTVDDDVDTPVAAHSTTISDGGCGCL
ncbi:MAG TPA: hypothetical protein PKW95_13665 [bacterium]|nr:hypothetical protein [bacterium]